MGLDFNLEAGNGVKIEADPSDKSITISLTNPGSSVTLTPAQIAALNNPKANGSSKFLTFREAADTINERDNTVKGFPKFIDIDTAEKEFKVPKTGIYKITAISGGSAGKCMIGETFGDILSLGIANDTIVEVNGVEYKAISPYTVDLPFLDEVPFGSYLRDGISGGGNKGQAGETAKGNGGTLIEMNAGGGGAGSPFPFHIDVKKSGDGIIEDKATNTKKKTYSGGYGYGAGGGGTYYDSTSEIKMVGGSSGQLMVKRVLMKKGETVKVTIGAGSDESFAENTTHKVYGGAGAPGAAMIEWDADQW